ncbi:hypothetical protein DYH10_01340 [Candidatus Saccharibacteria bacterium CPR2]|nr:hypothetical protein [Candidatus Saccharibacteria bacterium CPR2]
MSNETNELSDQANSDESVSQFTPGQTIQPNQETVVVSPEPSSLSQVNESRKEDLPRENIENEKEQNKETNKDLGSHQSETQRHELQNVRGQSHVDIAHGSKGENTITWEASEYVHHQKGVGWFAILSLIAIIFAVALYFVVDIWAAMVVILMAVTVIVYAQRKPEVLQYSITPEGLSIGNKNYRFDQFRSFNILHDGGIESIEFLPLKRFMPGISIYFDPAHKDQIINILSLQLPHEDKEPDFIDRLARQIRF